MNRQLKLISGAIASTASTLALVGAAFAIQAQSKPAEKTFSPQEIEYFETNVRPLLFEKCMSCHNDKLQQGGARLDSREAILKGGGSGPAMILGDPEKSRIITAIHYDAALKMPPSGKLKLTEIATLTQWVKMGAPWTPAKTGKTPVKVDPGANHWAFKPIKRPVPQKVVLKSWVNIWISISTSPSSTG